MRMEIGQSLAPLPSSLRSSTSSPDSAMPSGLERKPIWTDEDGTLHEQYRASVFIGQDHLGEFEFDPGSRPGLHYRRTGIAYYCPECGEVWARLVLWESNGRQCLLDAERVSCEKHEDQWAVAGSLLAVGLEDLIELLPEPALRREFNIYIKRLEKR